MRAKELGFETTTTITSRSGIHIVHRNDTFHIIPEKTGYNVYYPYLSDGLPWKKTRKPTWNQRCEFNHLVNDIFDELALSAHISSGAYRIRAKDGRDRDWSADISECVVVDKYTDEHKKEEESYQLEQRMKHRPTKKQLIKYMTDNDLSLAEMLVSDKEWERKHVSRFKWGK